MNATARLEEISMGFVIEKIDTPERRAELARFGLRSPFTAGPAVVRRWVVDRSRGLYFMNLGGGNAEIPYFLVLANSNEILARAEGQRRAEGLVVSGGVDENWTVDPIAIPKAHESRAADILAWLREALEAYGSLGDFETARSVTVSFGTPRFV